jgi:hypothetical protein
MNIDNITEEQAAQLVYSWADKYRWQVCLMTEIDIRDCWKEQNENAITDEELEQVKMSYYWRKMGDYTTQQAMEGLLEAIRDSRKSVS